LNDHHHHNQSSSSLLTASSTIITSVPADLSLSLPSKYIEGLVPTSILKSKKSSSLNIHLPPPTNSKGEQGKTSFTSFLKNLLYQIQYKNPQKSD
jgi:hypothetical protein